MAGRRRKHNRFYSFVDSLATLSPAETWTLDNTSLIDFAQCINVDPCLLLLSCGKQENKVES